MTTWLARCDLESCRVVPGSVDGEVVGAQGEGEAVSEGLHHLTEIDVLGLDDKRVACQTDGVDEEDDGDEEVVTNPPDQLSADHLQCQACRQSR